jgi:hypothetical protein
MVDSPVTKMRQNQFQKKNHYFSIIPTLAGDFLFTCLYMKLLDVSQG